MAEKSCLKVFRETKQSLITSFPAKMIATTIFSNCTGQMDVPVHNVETHAIGKAHGIFLFAANASTNNRLQPEQFFTTPRNSHFTGLRRYSGFTTRKTGVNAVHLKELLGLGSYRAA